MTKDQLAQVRKYQDASMNLRMDTTEITYKLDYLLEKLKTPELREAVKQMKSDFLDYKIVAIEQRLSKELEAI